jgi:alkaline phosphatase
MILTVIPLLGCQPNLEKRFKVGQSDSQSWQVGQSDLQRRLEVVQNTNKAKNVILFIADGMGISTITAARIYDGQSSGGSGEENSLSFEHFPHVALVKTYNTNAQVPDSAGTASAMNTGIKTRIGAISVREDHAMDNCRQSSHQHPEVVPQTIAEYAEEIGMSTGIISTARITHATPAAVYSHSSSRHWESDSDMPASLKEDGCVDIASQLIGFEFGDGLDVILGGGRSNFLPSTEKGNRSDQRNLVSEWLDATNGGNYVENLEQLRSLKQSNTNQVLGLFTPSYMSFETDRDVTQEPALSEMTKFAIDRLSKNSGGYFLMVEGGRVDLAHHDNNAYRALTDTQAFSEAIQTALDSVNLSETLILVTADHSHSLTINGYPKRGNNILGLVTPETSASPRKTDTTAGGKPFTTLGYRTGNIANNKGKKHLTETEVLSPDYRQQAFVSAESANHTGEDVALFAIGPNSHLVGGVIEQNTIYHLITYALGW